MQASWILCTRINACCICLVWITSDNLQHLRLKWAFIKKTHALNCSLSLHSLHSLGPIYFYHNFWTIIIWGTPFVYTTCTIFYSRAILRRCHALSAAICVSRTIVNILSMTSSLIFIFARWHRCSLCLNFIANCNNQIVRERDRRQRWRHWWSRWCVGCDKDGEDGCNMSWKGRDMLSKSVESKMKQRWL